MSDELELKMVVASGGRRYICAGKTFGTGSWLEPGPKGACQGTHGCRRMCRPFGPGFSHEPGPKVQIEPGSKVPAPRPMEPGPMPILVPVLY